MLGAGILGRRATAAPPARCYATAAAADDAAFAQLAGKLVHENKDRLFPDTDGEVEIVDVALGPAAHFQETRFGRWLEVRYRNGGRPASLKLWLKFRPGLDELYPLLLEYERRLDPRVFPRPCFAWRSPDGEAAIVATEFVGGTLLRDRFRQWAFTRQIARLEPIFRSNGAKMRAFHDASPPLGAIAVDEVVAAIVQTAQASNHLGDAEREAVLDHLARWRGRLGLTSLPAVRTHNDWVLRNIMIAPDGTDCIIDTDDMQAAPHWRWHDVGLFLLDLETQLKWSPLTTPRMLSRLWRAFWEGYVGERGLPEGLDAAQLPTIFCLVRLQWLIEGVIHQPHLEILLDGLRRNRRVRTRLKRGAVGGRYTLLDWSVAG
jgi:hypothetical protein